ncbi:MAG TPA: carbamoyltransferase HypF [Syntrophaceae bacterium]|nr:carbamoyltransferase HypF [Syntrophaceae bacterium]
MPEKRAKGRAKVTIYGIVQGVGFRPFIYQLAQERQLKGYVANTAFGVDIEVEGDLSAIEGFLRDIEFKKPPLAEITKFDTLFLPLKSYREFTIEHSRADTERSALISSDVSICDDCLKELFDPSDRRYRYPFINCTNCGPRYTIIKDIPYDRNNTTMQVFKMCKACREEYHNPLDRRFHAQPDACWDCGPRLSLHDNKGKLISCDDPIKKAIELLEHGKILAIKGLGGFHLAVDATNDEAVALLRLRKHREEKPLAMMSRDVHSIRKFAYVTEEEKRLLTSPKRPIVLLRKRERHDISREVAPRNKNFGVMLPYTPLHYLIFEGNFLALVMTSGNMSEEPIVIDNHDAFKKLSPIADYLLIHNRDIYLRNDDSILRVVDDVPRHIRRSRGYVPAPLFLKWKMEPILACGAELKNTICLTKGNCAFLSQHVGDVENLETLNFLELTIGHLKRILEIEPAIIAYDLHPQYLSTKFALEQKNMKLIGVQHHHAHITSCMAENAVDETVIGLSLDGTGYGLDNRIWGGEILVCKLESFERAGHFDYVPMPGGTTAIKQPWRMAISYLHYTYGQRFLELDIDFLKTVDKKRLKVILQMIERGINSPLTSSLGRLFDGVSALIGLRQDVKYEGQAAMELEMTMEENKDSQYPYEIENKGSKWILSYKSIIKGVVEDVINGLSPGKISTKFHNTLLHMLIEVCLRIRGERGLNAVALSGGVFQNAFLLQGLIKGLHEKDFRVYTHSKVPSNDGGIALGQAVIANAICKKYKTQNPSITK